MDLHGKCYVVTGGNSGIGFACAKELIRRGAKALICGRDQERLDRCLQELGANASGLAVDVSKLEELDQLFLRAKELYGRLDGVFINAGFAKFSPANQFTEQQFDELVNTNMKGAYFTATKAIPLLSENSCIIFTSSTAAMKGFPGSSIYAGAKAAVRSFAKVLAAELAPRKIRAVSISPGLIDTYGLKRNGIPAAERETALNLFKEMVPLKRAGEASEVAAAVAFLMSQEASYINGVNLVIDGGLTQV